MRRRDFLSAAAAATVVPGLIQPRAQADKPVACCGPTYASPQEAIKSPRETLLYATCVKVGVDDKPDYLATIDVDPNSKTHGEVIHRLPMPYAGDELHHFGWNACSSCHADHDKMRRYIVLPGLKSSRIHICDAADPRAPKLHKILDAKLIAAKTNLSAPHTVHCLADGQIMISMLGDAQGNSPGGFLLLDQNFEIVGRWEPEGAAPRFNYDFWYQPRHNVMVSSEWAAPNTFQGGFKLDDVKAGKYGSRIYFWDWKTRKVAQQIDLGVSGMIPLEVRFHHNPDSAHGFVGAALSSVMWHWHKTGDEWKADKVIEVEPIEHAGWPFPVPGLITDLLVSLDDKYLYFSNWLHGDLRQYDISDPAKPKLTGQLWLGGVLGRAADLRVKGKPISGGPQMLQLSLDGRRLYVTSSLYSSWDDQFYPQMAKSGSTMLQIDCDPAGGMKLNEEFLVDFGAEPGGPARAHEMRFPGGDSTSDIFV